MCLVMPCYLVHSHAYTINDKNYTGKKFHSSLDIGKTSAFVLFTRAKTTFLHIYWHSIIKLVGETGFHILFKKTAKLFSCIIFVVYSICYANDIPHYLLAFLKSFLC